MNISEFAKRIWPIAKKEKKYDCSDTASFCKKLFQEVIEFPKSSFDEERQQLIYIAEREIENRTSSAYNSYYYGKVTPPIATVVLPVFDVDRFAKYVVPDYEMRIEELCNAFSKEIPDINKENVGQKLALLFKNILEEVDVEDIKKADDNAAAINHKVISTPTFDISLDTVNYPLSYDVFGYCDEYYDPGDPEAVNIPRYLSLTESDIQIVADFISCVADYPDRHYKAYMQKRFKDLPESEEVLQKINKFRQSRSVKNVALYYTITMCYRYLRKYIKLLSSYRYEELSDADRPVDDGSKESKKRIQNLDRVKAAYGNFMTTYEWLRNAQENGKIFNVHQFCPLPYLLPSVITPTSAEDE